MSQKINTVSLENLIIGSLSFNLNLNQLIFLYCILSNNKTLLEQYVIKFSTFSRSDIINLISDGYIIEKLPNKPIFENYILTDKALNIFKFEVIKDDIEDWIDEWFELFPEGVKSGGYYVKTDKKSCLKKMKKFIKQYPEFDKTIILKATKDYVNNLRIKNYSHIKLAPYFIEKDGLSMLEGACRNTLNNMSKNSEEVSGSENIVIDI